MVWASPWDWETALPRRLRTSLFSWLPMTHRAEPASVMSMTVSSTLSEAGPRSARSPRNTALLPSGWAGISPV